MYVLTFDIEDWFHTHENRQNFSGKMWTSLPSRVVDNTMRILDLLDEFEIKATFFILGWVAEHHPELVKKIYSKGHEIGSHSHWHHNANKLVFKDFEKDLVRSINVLSELTGSEIISHRAPGFSIKEKNAWAFEILISHGIINDSSIQTLAYRHNKPFYMETKSGKIFEFPLVKSKLGFPYTGGGYFRALPEFLLKPIFDSADKYTLLYFHPRDFDNNNPVSNLFSVYRNFLNSYNTDKSMVRLRNILKTNKVISISEAIV